MGFEDNLSKAESLYLLKNMKLPTKIRKMENLSY